MKKITLICLFLLSLSISAQIKKPLQFGKEINTENRSPSGYIRCASVEYEALLKKNDSKRLSDQEFENWLAPLIEKYKNAPNYRSETGGIITIPVVVHVIHNGDAYGSNENIRDEQIESQITVLNQDFRRLAGTPGFGIGVDTQIQFALAKVDPSGNPTNGINRVNLCRTDWNAGSNSATLALVNAEIKPITIWNANDYLNMWSVNFGSLGLLGYAQFPSSSGLGGLDPSGGAANTDGVVSNFGTFGARTIYPAGNYVGTQYDKGRTMTHEVGHWVGLRHLWGDGDCNFDDFCADTPNCNGQFFAGLGVPTGCAGPTQCGFTRQVENYMDYSDDACMSIYTQNQKDRMVTVFNNSPRRQSLKTSTKDIAIALFANDAEIKIENACDVVPTCTNPNGGLPSKVISLYNRGTSTLTAASISYNINGGTTFTNNWSGSLAPNKFVYITLANTAVNGTLNASITVVNGTTDQRATNNNASKTFNNTSTTLDNHNYTTFTFNLVGDPFGSETTWDLKNSSGATLFSGGPYSDLSAPGTQTLVNNQTWNLPMNGCYTFTIYDSFGDGITGSGFGVGSWTITTNGGATTVGSGGTFTTSQSKQFTNGVLSNEDFDLLNSILLYPNPTNSILNISIPVELNFPANYEIYNNLGQVIKSSNSSSSELQINTSEFSNGIYFIKLNFENNSKTLRFIKN